MRVTHATKQATRRKILDAAKQLFSQQGFESTTTRDIARAAKIASGTLFNYFPTKEALAQSLIHDAWDLAGEALAADSHVVNRPPSVRDVAAAQHQRATLEAAPAATMEEELFAHLAAILRKLKPHRAYLPSVLDTSFSPLVDGADGAAPSLRATHLEAVAEILSRHGQADAASSVALQLYWTLITGVLAFWARDPSPRQEDTLALLAESLGMFSSWLTRSVPRAPESTNSTGGLSHGDAQ